MSAFSGSSMCLEQNIHLKNLCIKEVRLLFSGCGWSTTRLTQHLGVMTLHSNKITATEMLQMQYRIYDIMMRSSLRLVVLLDCLQVYGNPALLFPNIELLGNFVTLFIGQVLT